MRINYLELSNYRRFEHVELELPDGIIGIVGNNGAGKSTLVESIAWALFGNQKDIVRAGKDSVRKHDARAGEPTVAKLEFSYAGDEYVVTREMSGKALTIDASLVINGQPVATGANEVSDLIEKKLGMDYKSFFISVFAKQKDLAALSSMNPSERRAKILRMLGIDRLDWILEETNRREKSKKEKVEYERVSLNDEKGQPKRPALKKKADDLRQAGEVVGREILQRKKELESSKNEEVATDKRMAENGARLKTLRELSKKSDAVKASLASCKKDVDRISKSLEDAEKAKEMASGLEQLNLEISEKKKRKEKLTALKVDHDNSIRMKSELASIDEELAEAKKELSKAEEELGRSAEVASSINEHKAQMESLEKDISIVKERRSELKERMRSRKESAASDEKHLSDMEKLGPDSICQTCDRPLGEHHAKLKGKLSSSLEKTKAEISSLESLQKEAAAEEADLLQSYESLKKRGEALKKKEMRLVQLQRDVDGGRKNLKALEGRRKKVSDDIGKTSAERFDKAELDSLVKSLDELNGRRDGMMETAAIAKKIPELRESLSKAKAEAERHDAAMRDIKVDPAEVELLEAASEELEVKRKSLRENIYAINENIIALTKKSEASNAGIREIDKEIESLRGAEEKLKVLEEELAYATKLSDIMKAFRNSLVARIIPTLSEVASELLSQLTEGRYTSLTLDDSYNIFVEDGGVKHVLERFSGGESDLANLCLRLAISRVIAERAGTQGINLLVLDEIFGSQDASRKRNLMASFNALSNQFRQILLITHIDDIREHLSSVVEVYEDEKGESRVKLSA